MKLKSLLLILHIETKVTIIYNGASIITSGYPIHLFENLPDDILDLQIQVAQAIELNKLNVRVVRRKQQ